MIVKCTRNFGGASRVIFRYPFAIYSRLRTSANRRAESARSFRKANLLPCLSMLTVGGLTLRGGSGSRAANGRPSRRRRTIHAQAAPMKIKRTDFPVIGAIFSRPRRPRDLLFAGLRPHCVIGCCAEERNDGLSCNAFASV